VLGKICNFGFTDTVADGSSFQSVCPDAHSLCVPSNDEKRSPKAASFRGSGSQCNGSFCSGLARDSEVTSNMKGLLLFPDVGIHVSIIYCGNLRTDLYNMPPEVSNLQENCKLIILNNDTTSPEVEIPCENAMHICLEHQRLSFVGIKDKTELDSSGSMRAEYVVGNKDLPPNVKVWISSSLCL